MGKTYILTFHRALNYGAVLQCYALYKTVSAMCDCQVIDYRSRAIENRYRMFANLSSAKALIKKLVTRKRMIIKRRKFNDFLHKNIILTKPLRNAEALKRYNWASRSLFCVGSDQVWNLELTEDDSAFFLDFIPQDSAKISYAASIGICLDSKMGEVFKSRLEDFDSISVREKSAMDNLTELNVKCLRCIDPVYLLDADEWKKIVPKSSAQEPYVLLYLLQKDPILAEGAAKYAKEHKLKLTSIQTGLRKDYDAEYIATASPEEFVGLFCNADAVFTNSFHGISFSVLFHKLFFYRYQGNAVKTNNRLKDTVELFGLQKQEYSDENGFNEKIDYQSVEQIILSEKNRAVAYLKSYIKK